MLAQEISQTGESTKMNQNIGTHIVIYDCDEGFTGVRQGMHPASPVTYVSQVDKTEFRSYVGAFGGIEALFEVRSRVPIRTTLASPNTSFDISCSG